MTGSAARAMAYDRYVQHRLFVGGVLLFALLLLLPPTDGMRRVAAEREFGAERARDAIAGQLFGAAGAELPLWQAETARLLALGLRHGSGSPPTVLERGAGQAARAGEAVGPAALAAARRFAGTLAPGPWLATQAAARASRRLHDPQEWSAEERARAARGARHLKLCLALAALVVYCLLTEAMPLPGVAFLVGVALVLGGVVSRREVASLYWTDACWFILGSLMCAAAFVRTGVDRRICLAVFSSLARPRVAAVIAILILVLAPASSFISDHALAAMFLPVGILLYETSVREHGQGDPELAKLLMITICMATNIGGFGAPSGGARNVIVMGYLEEMADVSIGYGRWLLMAMPFVLLMMPILWLLLRWRFRPRTVDLGPALARVRADVARPSGWDRRQVAAIVIFLLMLAGWITEENLLARLLGVRLGIGVIAIMGALAYLLGGIVNWRDYQERVDWGVVWLYGGAILLGRALDATGAAEWLARALLAALAAAGLSGPLPLLGAAGLLTTLVTNLMADGPAAAAMGPLTLSMAAAQGGGTVLVPFMGLVTACASSFAYMLIIGTPPNAIVYASGYLTPRDFLRVGAPALGAALVIMLLLALFWWPRFAFPGLAPL